MSPEKRKQISHVVEAWATWAARGLLIFFASQTWIISKDNVRFNTTIEFHDRAINKLQDQQAELKKTVDIHTMQIYQVTQTKN